MRGGRVQQSGLVAAMLSQRSLEACFDVPMEVVTRADGSAAYLIGHL